MHGIDELKVGDNETWLARRGTSNIDRMDSQVRAHLSSYTQYNWIKPGWAVAAKETTSAATCKIAERCDPSHLRMIFIMRGRMLLTH
jgi:hypothetical protein